MGVIYYRYLSPSPKKGTEDNQGESCSDGQRSESSNKVKCKEAKEDKPHKTKAKRIKVSLGIELSHKEWLTYHSGKYSPTEEMPSAGITYGQFHKFMDMVRKTVDDNRFEEDVKFLVQSAMMKMITAN